MTRVILDTNVAGEMIRRSANVRTLSWVSAQEFDSLYLTSITLSELWYGVEALEPSDARRGGFTAKLDIIEQQFAERILSFDVGAARIWGQLKGRHGRQGRTYPDIDLQIAAIALCHRMSLATVNTKDFDGLGIDLIDPLR
jgi:hypothetical protein